MTYDALLALINGLPNPTRKGLQQTLPTLNFLFSDATGLIKFLLPGDRTPAMQLIIDEPGN